MADTNTSGPINYNPEPGLDDLTPAYSLTLMILQGILAFVGSVGNILTILAVVLYKKLHKVNHIYVAHLAMVDLIISAFLVPTNIIGLVKGVPENCAVIGAVALSCLVVSILSLFMIALNRYVLICKSIRTYARWYNRYTLVGSIVGMWLWAFAVVLPMSSFNGLGWSQKTHYCFFINYDFVTYLYMTLGLAQGGVVLPAAATSYCYIMIIRKLRKYNAKFSGNNRKQHKTSSSEEKQTDASTPNVEVNTPGIASPSSRLTSDLSTTENNETDDADEESYTPGVKYAASGDSTKTMTQNQLKKAEQKRKLHNKRIVGLILIFTIFMICWLPIALTFTVDYKQQLPGAVYATLITFAWVNSAVNILLYAFTNHMYRYAFKCIITCNFSRINHWK